ncbi:hypothetical protein ACSBR2_029083 [Camellia fascicularis]
MKHVASLSRPSRRKSRIFSYENHESRRSLPTPLTGVNVSSTARHALDVCSEPLVLGLCTSGSMRNLAVFLKFLRSKTLG